MNSCTRRRFIVNCMSALPALGLACASGNSEKVKIRAITQASGYHWFGSGNRPAFSTDDRYVLCHALEVKKRLPTPDDVIRIGMIDIKNNDRWYELANTQTWNTKQDCMLQWRPGSETQLLWNNRQGSNFGSVLLDIKSGQKQFLPYPVYTIHPDGKSALTLDFERLNDLCPGYGYVGLTDTNHDKAAPDNAGISRLDLESGERLLLLSLAQIAAIDPPEGDYKNARHYVNFLQFNTDGTRFSFTHGWSAGLNGENPAAMVNRERVVTAAVDGSSIRVYNDLTIDAASNWSDAQQFLSKRTLTDGSTDVILVNDTTGERQAVGKDILSGDGSYSFIPVTDWLTADTAGETPETRRLFLYNRATGAIKNLGSFTQPTGYNKEWRLQLYPLPGRYGNKLIINSAHKGNGPQLYLVEFGKL